ncbi:MAG: 2Fe-2S iron-sulfur cluster-binding protein [Actinomycetota bacterium]
MSDDQPGLGLTVDGNEVTVADPAGTLLDLLRDQLRITEVKDGCSPQGQCGCCTVLVDGQPRVSCVTPVRRVAGRAVTTAAGLDADRLDRWQEAFTACGASQCGFCTPGIVVRLDALDRLKPGSGHDKVAQALLAHLCRCTGWQTITEAWDRFRGDGVAGGCGTEQAQPTAAVETPVARAGRDAAAAGHRASLEGGSHQSVGWDVVLGRGGFAVDTAPEDALIAVSDGADGWAVGESLREARAAVGKVQGRRTTVDHSWPLDVPDAPDGTGWDATLRTTWVEPGYLETDAAWCAPGGEPATTLANGGAFGAKQNSPVTAASRALADEHGRPVLVLASREDATRWGPKRPPVAGGADADGTGALTVVATPGVVEAIAAVAPGLTVAEVEVPGPPTSAAIRAAGWAEALVLLAGATGRMDRIVAPNGAEATADIVDGVIRVGVRCGRVLDEVTLRSYCIGAAHMAWSWVTSEALTVDAEGTVHDLTVRSFGIARAVDTPPVEVAIESDDGEPVNGSDAVFAAVAGVTWLRSGRRPDWPVGADHVG